MTSQFRHSQEKICAEVCAASFAASEIFDKIIAVVSAEHSSDFLSTLKWRISHNRAKTSIAILPYEHLRKFEGSVERIASF